MDNNHKIEPIVYLICSLVVLFSFTLIGVAKFMSSDGQTFQIIAGLVTGFSGALLMRIKPRGTKEDDDINLPSPPSRVTVNETKETIAETKE